MSSSLSGSKADEAELYPIKYFAERLPVDCKNQEELYETVF